MNTQQPSPPTAKSIAVLALLALPPLAALNAQQMAVPANDPAPEKRIPAEPRRATGDPASDEDVVLMTPFVVSSEKDNGYAAVDTLAGTRLRTELRDVGAAISVVTAQFMADTASTNAKDMLIYTTNTEIGGIEGNTSGATLTATASSNTAVFDSPSQTTRVRGLSGADLMRDFFATSIPMDSYNTERVDISRGANAILYGIGSPAGIINNQLKSADTRTRKFRVQGSLGSFGSYRGTFDFNVPIMSNQLAVRVTGLNDKRYHRQEPAYEWDKRLFITAKWEKKLFKDSISQIEAGYENGRQNSNRPRVTPPQDGLTLWFDPQALNKWSCDGSDANAVRSNAALYPTYLDWPGRWMNYTLGSIFENPYSGSQSMSRMGGYTNAVDPAGASLNTWGPASYSKAGAYNNFIGNQRFYAANGLPSDSPALTGLWRQQEILDSSVYDFHTQLLDGANKWEKARFDAFNVSFRQTFFNNKLGFELVYDRQNYDRASFQPYFSEGATIMVDMLRTNFDGTPNANYGRPYIASDSGGSEGNDDKEAFRATVFGELDFRQKSGWARHLGRHVFTTAYSEQKQRYFSRGFNGYAYSFDDLNPYYSTQAASYYGYGVVRYLGDSIANLSSPADAHISNARAPQNPGRNVTSQFWDAVNQQWVTITPTLYNYHDDIDRLYNSAAKWEAVTKSKVVVWQGYLLGDKLVGLIGWREDDYEQRNAPAAPRQAGTNVTLPHDPAWKIPGQPGATDPVLKESTISWSVVGHTPGFAKRWLPRGMDASVFYNRSKNFRPASVAADPYGELFDPPQGSTRDVGVLLSFANRKLTVRINNYKTVQKNDAVWVVNDYWYGNDMTRFLNGLKQSNTPEWIINKWFGFEPGDPRYLQPRASWTGAPGSVNPTLTSAEATARTNWFKERTREEWLANPLMDQKLADSWKLALNTSNATWTCTRPPNIKNTNDTESSGWEGEVTYNPTKSWRMILNVAQQKAKRSNVGGDLVEFINNNLPLWTDGNGVFAKNMREVDGFEDVTHYNNFSTTLGTQGMKNVYVPWLNYSASSNTSVPELRQWRANFITNYDFRAGRLKGFSIGGAVRWQDKVAIGYKPKLITTSVGQTWVTDRDRPVCGPTETNFDAWFRYGRKIFRDKIHWSVQLNIRDIFGSEDLIPVSTQPDGSIASARIPQPNRWMLTNSFDF